MTDVNPQVQRPWKQVPFTVGYPSSDEPWEAIASPGHNIFGRDVLFHAVWHFQARGEHYLTVRITDGMSRPVLDDEPMDALPATDGVVSLRLVKLI